MNKLIIIGNLVTDAEMDYSPEGLAKTKFRVADNHKYTGTNGAKIEETTYHNIILFGERAETYVNLLPKGTKVYVEGRLKVREYTPAGSQTKQKYYEVTNPMIEILSPKNKSTDTNMGYEDEAV